MAKVQKSTVLGEEASSIVSGHAQREARPSLARVTQPAEG